MSDDEDDTHPNIDTASLFRWRHEARLNRDREWKKEKEEFEKSKNEHILALQKARTEYEKGVKVWLSLFCFNFRIMPQIWKNLRKI